MLRDIENHSPEDLEEVHGDFYTEVEKKDASRYEPEFLEVMKTSLYRYLKYKGYKVRGNYSGTEGIRKV